MGSVLKVCCVIVLLSSCSVSRIDTTNFERHRSNMSASFLKEYENNILYYREGSSGGNSGKKGGGCGCN
ncbi:MAG: DUF4266 domain-containing protein [Chitinophagales bacterium]|nr:DUF4266 domain-containing protein [Chitinophagales bacterium]